MGRSTRVAVMVLACICAVGAIIFGFGPGPQPREERVTTVPHLTTPTKTKASSDLRNTRQQRPRPERRRPHVADSWVRYIVPGVALAILLGVGAGLLLRLWGRRRLDDDSVPVEELDDESRQQVADALNDRLEATRTELLEGDDARTAVLRAWVEVQRAVAETGQPRSPSETSAELTVRVLRQWDVDEAPLRLLAGAYREAYFSGHPVGDDTRRSVAEALDSVLVSLRARRSDVAAR